MDAVMDDLNVVTMWTQAQRMKEYIAEKDFVGKPEAEIMKKAKEILNEMHSIDIEAKLFRNSLVKQKLAVEWDGYPELLEIAKKHYAPDSNEYGWLKNVHDLIVISKQLMDGFKETEKELEKYLAAMSLNTPKA